MREQIADYLAQGYKAAQVAGMLGCSEAYISELYKTDEQFKNMLREKFKEHMQLRLVNKYDHLEERIIKEIDDSIANCDINDLTRVLEAIARIKNANKSIIPPGHHSNPTIGLTLIVRQDNQPKLVTDDKNRVISIGDKTMLPMPAKAVRDMFKERAANEENNTITIEQLAS